MTMTYDGGTTGGGIASALHLTSRKALRQAVGSNLGKMDVSAATANGTTTTIVDANLRGGDDEHNGKWVVFHDGDNAGLIRRVSDYVASTNTLTVTPAALGDSIPRASRTLAAESGTCGFSTRARCSSRAAIPMTSPPFGQVQQNAAEDDEP